MIITGTVIKWVMNELMSKFESLDWAYHKRLLSNGEYKRDILIALKNAENELQQN